MHGCRIVVSARLCAPREPSPPSRFDGGLDDFGRDAGVAVEKVKQDRRENMRAKDAPLLSRMCPTGHSPLRHVARSFSRPRGCVQPGHGRHSALRDTLEGRIDRLFRHPRRPLRGATTEPAAAAGHASERLTATLRRERVRFSSRPREKAQAWSKAPQSFAI